MDMSSESYPCMFTNVYNEIVVGYSNQYILGASFLRNYYTVLNYTTNEIGLAISTSAPTGVDLTGNALPTPTPTPSPDDDDNDSDDEEELDTWEIILIVLGGCIVLAALVFGICKASQARAEKRDAQIAEAQAMHQH